MEEAYFQLYGGGKVFLHKERSEHACYTVQDKVPLFLHFLSLEDEIS